jgi:hypothetical protein
VGEGGGGRAGIAFSLEIALPCDAQVHSPLPPSVTEVIKSISDH